MDALFSQHDVEVPLADLVSWRGDSLREHVRAAGVDPFDKKIKETPHFEALQLIDLPLDSCGKCAYVAYYDSLVRLGCTRRNNGETITSGIDRLSTFFNLYRKIEKSNRIDPIHVAAEDDGKFRITDGLHRSAIAFKLGSKAVPARIVSVDAEIQRLLELLYLDWPPRELTLYQPVEHPIFARWKVVRPDERWNLIRNSFDWRGKTILDVGSYTGFFSRQIYRCGASVTGVEIDENRLAIAVALNRLLRTNVSYIPDDYRKVLKTSRFDAVLFLSILHWILKNEGLAGVSRCLALLSEAAPVMFLDSASDREEKMRTNAWNHGVQLNRESIPEIVLANSTFLKWRHLGTDSLDRDLFIFWR